MGEAAGAVDSRQEPVEEYVDDGVTADRESVDGSVQAVGAVLVQSLAVGDGRTTVQALGVAATTGAEAEADEAS